MATHLNPYLSFRDNAREAMEFYQTVFGGTLEVTTFGEFNMAQDPADTDKVMHSMLTSNGGLVLMGSDAPSSMDSRELSHGTDHTVSLSGEDETELRGYWDKLSDGGQVAMPFEKAPWGDTFGMCTDKFGVPWMINVAGTPAQ
ncbi:VOC family protein [Arthrobacter sp.]|uniref:VOC family protein n=1 Tax=Arthrobacter sp. TaxID=1667 RepID=UPI0026DECED7|nr:VOC family protein [Arthrobacter sp.]MDO5752725.1 VOC family protein [Arthrobacter sp.]